MNINTEDIHTMTEHSQIYEVIKKVLNNPVQCVIIFILQSRHLLLRYSFAYSCHSHSQAVDCCWMSSEQEESLVTMTQLPGLG